MPRSLRHAPRAALAAALLGLLALPAPGEEPAPKAPDPPTRDAAAGVTVVANRSIRARSVLTAADLRIEPGATPGAVDAIAEAVGLEARKAIFANRAVMAGDLGPPAVIERNEVVTLLYRKGALSIAAEGRALGRGGVGDRVRVLNLDSRNTISGTVAAPGLVEVR